MVRFFGTKDLIKIKFVMMIYTGGCKFSNAVLINYDCLSFNLSSVCQIRCKAF